MSRPRLPTARLKLVGAFKKDPQRLAARAGEPEVTTPLGDPPAYFNASRREAWYEIQGQAPWVTGADRIPVERLSVLLVRWRDGEATAAQEKMLDALCIRVGLTPADRSRIKVPGTKKPTNAFGELAG